jgi:hypothetical protein
VVCHGCREAASAQGLGRRCWPTLPVLFVTGFADRTAVAGISGAQLTSQPLVDEELARKVRLALAEAKKVIHLRR